MNPKKIIKILPQHNLLRRFISPNPPNFQFIKDDGSICSTCFHLIPNEQGLSVDVEHLTTYEKAIPDKSKYKLLSLNAGEVQNLDLQTIHDPLKNNYAHALIKGAINKKKARQLAKIANIVQIKF